MAKCKYKLINDKRKVRYECDIVAPEGKEFCIFHDKNEEKDAKEFLKLIDKQMSSLGYDFIGYHFPKNVSFSGKTFEERPDFSEAVFSDTANFTEAVFKRGAEFKGTCFKEGALFQDAVFERTALFDKAKFKGPAFFVGTTAQSDCDFDGAKFKSECFFDGATFGGHTGFDDAKFKGVAFFDGTKFLSATLFSGAKFLNEAHFARASFALTVEFLGTSFKRLEDAEVAYSKAKTAFQGQGNYAQAGYYYLLEKRVRRRQKHPIIRVLEWIFFDLTCGYGEQWLKVIPAALVLVFGCALLYYFFFPITSPEIEITQIGWAYFVDCLYFSFSAFATLGFAVSPAGWTRLVVAFEAICGAYVMLLFAFCIGMMLKR